MFSVYARFVFNWGKGKKHPVSKPNTLEIGDPLWKCTLSWRLVWSTHPLHTTTCTLALTPTPTPIPTPLLLLCHTWGREGSGGSQLLPISKRAFECSISVEFIWLFVFCATQQRQSGHFDKETSLFLSMISVNLFIRLLLTLSMRFKESGPVKDATQLYITWHISWPARSARPTETDWTNKQKVQETGRWPGTVILYKCSLAKHLHRPPYSNPHPIFIPSHGPTSGVRPPPCSSSSSPFNP